MNADDLHGQWAQFKELLKRRWGRFSDADLLEIAGNYERFLHKAHERYGDKKADVLQWADYWHRQAIPESSGANELTSSVIAIETTLVPWRAGAGSSLIAQALQRRRWDSRGTDDGLTAERELADGDGPSSRSATRAASYPDDRRR